MTDSEFQKIRAAFKSMTAAARVAAVNAMTDEQRNTILKDLGGPTTTTRASTQTIAQQLSALAAKVYDKRRADQAQPG